MVALEIAQQSNAQIGRLGKGLVALFIGATSGIAQQTLKLFVKHADSPVIYSVARPSSAAAHQKLLARLRDDHPQASLNLITADFTLISEIDKVAAAVKQKEKKLDFLFLSTGFIAFDGRFNTSEGLDPSMTTRYYSRIRAVQQLLPLLNNSPSPRIMFVGAGGMEAPVNENDLDLRGEGAWTFWSSSVHSTTMATLSLEKFAKENPKLSIVHYYPGPVETPGLERARNSGKLGGMSLDTAMKVEESGERVLFMATSDMYCVGSGGVPVADGAERVERSAGGIWLLQPDCEAATKSEEVLTEMRGRGVADKVWSFTEAIFADCTPSK